MNAPATVSTLRLATPFSDHAVLQRDRPLPVWGTAAPGSRVEVTLAGNAGSACADAEGRWRVDLAALPAGGPHRLVATSGGERVAIEDVLIGEVWLGSGQSNMAWRVAISADPDEACAAATDPRIRLLTLPGNPQIEPQTRDDGAAWQLATPATVREFSAVAWNFARHLRPQVDVPIGIIVSAWGGTPIETWMAVDALACVPSARQRHDEVRRQHAAYLATLAEDTRRFQAELQAWKDSVPVWEAARDVKDPGIAGKWADPAVDDGDWGEAATPGAWEAPGLKAHSGTVWFRRRIEIPPHWAGQPLTLELGAINNSDEAWIDGMQVGTTTILTPEYWAFLRRYPVPAHLAKAGSVLITVRVDSHGARGGFKSPARLLRLVGPAGEALPLAGTWRWKLGMKHGPMPGGIPQPKVPPFDQNAPSALFNGQLLPLIPYAIRGALWYQGESNTASNAVARDYAILFAALITDWRRRWGQDFAFYWCQLAAYQPSKDAPGPLDSWAVIRESQTATLNLPATGQAVLLDIGEAGNIHPMNKKEVGRRLALIARKQVYGESVAHSGPVLAGHAIADGAIVLRFAHADGGLVARGGALRRFAIAGDDRVFHWAEATIAGDAVVVRSPAVPRPVAVRYACETNPDGANLCNGAGLPAGPFRTDTWDS